MRARSVFFFLGWQAYLDVRSFTGNTKGDFTLISRQDCHPRASTRVFQQAECLCDANRWGFSATMRPHRPPSVLKQSTLIKTTKNSAASRHRVPHLSHGKA